MALVKTDLIMRTNHHTYAINYSGMLKEMTPFLPFLEGFGGGVHLLTTSSFQNRIWRVVMDLGIAIPKSVKERENQGIMKLEFPSRKSPSRLVHRHKAISSYRESRFTACRRYHLFIYF